MFQEGGPACVKGPEAGGNMACLVTVRKPVRQEQIYAIYIYPQVLFLNVA